MTFWGAVHHLARLIAFDSTEWGYIPYYLRLKRLGIDVGLTEIDSLGLSGERANGHSNSGGPDLAALLKVIGVTPRDRILDIGCGKGGAMLTMAQFPFAQIDGVELSPELAQIAKENFRKAGISKANVFCCDATGFTAFHEYTHLYMYNPFPALVARQVSEQVVKSAQNSGAKVTVIYRHPVHDELLRKSGLVKTQEYHNYVLNFPVERAADRTFYLYETQSPQELEEQEEGAA